MECPRATPCFSIQKITSAVMWFPFQFPFSSRWHRSARKGPYTLRSACQQSPQGCPRNSANVCLVEHRLDGQVVRRPPRERKIPGSNLACAGIFSGSSHTSDFKIGTPVATLPGAWRYRVSTGTGRPGVSIL